MLAHKSGGTFLQSTGLVKFQASNPHSFLNNLLKAQNTIVAGPCQYTGYRLYIFSCSTQLSMKCIMLINVKISTVVGISTFITCSMAITASESLKARKVLIF